MVGLTVPSPNFGDGSLLLLLSGEWDLFCCLFFFLVSFSSSVAELDFLLPALLQRARGLLSRESLSLLAVTVPESRRPFLAESSAALSGDRESLRPPRPP